MKKLNRALTILAAAVLVLSLTGCSEEVSTEPLKIGVPSDATNQARAINLLEAAGFIDVDDAAGFTPELKDIKEYYYNIEIVPAAANTLVATLDDYGASTINGTYAIPAGLNPEKDGLITEIQDESAGNPFINVIAARREDENNETYKTIVQAYQSQEIAQYILTKNAGASIPAFDYDPNFTVGENYVSDLEGYQSSPDGKTVVKLGVCGSGDVWRAVQKVLDDQNAGIYIDVIIFDAYNLPNEALDSGEIDLNSFQHVSYLNSEIESQGYDLVPIGNTSRAPLTLYSKKASSLEELKTLAGKK